MEVCFISVVFNHDCALESLEKLRKKAKKNKTKQNQKTGSKMRGSEGLHWLSLFLKAP